MQVTVVRPADLGEGEAAQWRAFQGSSLLMSHPFLSLSYVKAWGVANANVRVTVVEENGRIEAFIPYEIGDGKIAALTGGTQTYIDGFVSSGAPLDMRTVVRRSGLRGWRFSRAPVEQKALDPYRYDGAHHRRTGQSIDLSGGYDKYLSDLRDGVKKTITKAERSRRALQREAGPVSFDWRNQKPEYFDQLIEWKSAQYANVRGWSPAVISVMRELAFADNDDCRGLLGVLFAGEQTAAVSLNLEGPGIVAGWTMAYNPELSRFSVGTIQFLDFIRDVAAHDIKMLDLGADFTGGTSYKHRFGNASYELSGGGVWASRLGAAVRSLYRTVKYRDSSALVSPDAET
jgi:CelD/BcsL family acetyltransferase involved in cellulose biosynthesis